MKVEAVTFVAIEPMPMAASGAAFDEAMTAVENESVVADEARTDREAKRDEDTVDPALLAATIPFAPAPAPSSTPSNSSSGSSHGAAADSTGQAASPSLTRRLPFATRDHHGGKESTEEENLGAVSSTGQAVLHAVPNGPSSTQETDMEAAGATPPQGSGVTDATTARGSGAATAARGAAVSSANASASATNAMTAQGSRATGATPPQGGATNTTTAQGSDATNTRASAPGQQANQRSLSLRPHRASVVNIKGDSDSPANGAATESRRADSVKASASAEPVGAGAGDGCASADAARIMNAIEPTLLHTTHMDARAENRSVNVPSVVNAPTEIRDAAAVVRAAETTMHKRVLAEGTATGTVTLPELGRIDVEARAATHERPIFVQVRADLIATTDLLVSQANELHAHVREAAPAAHVAIERGFAQNDHDAHDQRQPERRDVDDETRPAAPTFRRTARFVL